MATRQSSCRTVWPGEMSWLATNTRPTPGLEDSVNNLDIWNVVGRQEGISQGFSLFLCGERREGQLC